MMTTRLLKRSVPVAVMGTALGLVGVSAGDDRHHDGDHDKDHDKDHHKHHDGDCDKDKDHDEFCFKMVVSGGAANCLPNARARVKIKSLGPVERMRVEVSGLPANTDFDFFVIQVPKAPFGLSWYQGDIDTNAHGSGTGEFMGRFNEETFIVAPGVAPAPVVHDQPPFPDASSNPTTAPVHTFHLGLWFNSPADALKAGCPGTVTPFNGDHTAGIQVLNTSNFPDDQGPLRQVMP